MIISVSANWENLNNNWLRNGIYKSKRVKK